MKQYLDIKIGIRGGSKITILGLHLPSFRVDIIISYGKA